MSPLKTITKCCIGQQAWIPAACSYTWDLCWDSNLSRALYQIWFQYGDLPSKLRNYGIGLVHTLCSVTLGIGSRSPTFKLLYCLTSAHVSLVEDESLIEVRQITKMTSEEVKEKLAIASKTDLTNNKACDEFRPGFYTCMFLHNFLFLFQCAPTLDFGKSLI